MVGLSHAKNLVAALALLLAACGFEPLHSEVYREQTRGALANVRVEVDTTRLGQLLKAEIEDGINPEVQPAGQDYAITIQLLEREIALFINPDGTSSRGDIEFYSQYKLVRLADGAVINSGQIKRVSSYNTSESADYSSYVSEEDARRRGILELAQDYKLRLSNLVPRLSGQAI